MKSPKTLKTEKSPQASPPPSETQESNTKPQIASREEVIEAISAAGLDEFVEYIRSPWKMLWPNFVAGIARGVGALVGAALVIALIGWVLSKMITLPVIGATLEPYVTEVQKEINKYTESTNYKSHFESMETLLREIRDEMRQQNARP